MAIAGRVKLFFDGGWRPASGMEIAVVVQGRDYVRQGLGPGSAMDAEWLALLHAVELAGEFGLHEAVFLGDSLAVVGQANGTVRCPRDHIHHLQALASSQSRLGKLQIRHVKRSQNLAGVALARLHGR
jgi:ribonuclease HI